MPLLALCLSVLSLSFSGSTLWVLLELADQRRPIRLDEMPELAPERARRTRELALVQLCRLDHALKPYGLLMMAGGGIDQ